MAIAAETIPNTYHGAEITRDEVTRYADRTWDELFTMDRAEAEEFQLNAARRRFEELRPRVKALDAQAESNGVTRIGKLADVVPLLFNHTAYKSYPMSLLEKSRFDMLTKWFQSMTSIDLSGVDARGCGGIDHWMEMLELQTPLQIFHTSGTSGKLSFFPRTTLERDLWDEGYLKMFQGFGREPGTKVGGADGVRAPVIYPSVRHGRYVAQRLLTMLEREVAPTPDQLYTLSNGTLSADLVSLSGRIRVAQAKGSLHEMKLSESMRVAMRRYLEEQERRPQEMAAFFESIINKLQGKRVFLTSQSSYLLQASREGLARGVHHVFAPNSLGTTGGGGKDVVLPDNWLEIISDFTGLGDWKMSYAMTEMIGIMPRCAEGYYHIAPYHIAFLLDPESGDLLPRDGTQTGRFAALDLLAQTYWGGIISGDKVTIDWDANCPCGRKGPRVHDYITRYSTNVTGDDKITCSATVDNTDSALQQLLAG